ncbi:hypothetical protein BH09BAC5_BH09BAC5_09630 [soil metagenome]
MHNSSKLMKDNFQSDFLRKIILFCCFVFYSANIFAQSSSEILIRSFATKDSVMLRWVPSNPEIWRAGIKYGYTIERFTADQYLDLNGSDEKGFVLNSNPILPLPQSDTNWNSLIRSDKINAFVFESLFQTTTPQGNDPKKKTEDQIRFGFTLKACDLSIETAKAHGLYFCDKTITPGQIYIYRISIANSAQKSPLVFGIVTSDENLSLLKSPENVHGMFRNRKAAILFDAKSTRASYAGYIIERSEDSLHFARINSILLTFAQSQYEKDKTELTYQDSLPQNHKVFWYRVRGFSYFGIEGPPSLAVKGSGRDEWTLFPEIDTLYSQDTKTVEIKWHVPNDKSISALKLFSVFRATTSEGPFNKIDLPKNDSIAFQYKDLNPMNANYYEIAAISIYGDTAFSFPYYFGLPDNTPPDIPKNISGTIDTNGIVKLTWNKVQSEELKGYRIFRSNSLKEEFIEVSDSILKENYFTDTIEVKTLTKDVYYSVRSVDFRYNNSENASPIKLKRPDKIPPVAAIINSLQQTDSTINVSWINSSSDDVMCLELISKSDSGTIIHLGNWNGNDTARTYTLFHPVPESKFQFSLIVTDSSANSTISNSQLIQFHPRIYPALKHLSANPDFEKRTIQLSWEKPV